MTDYTVSFEFTTPDGFEMDITNALDADDAEEIAEKQFAMLYPEIEDYEITMIKELNSGVARTTA